MQELFVRLFDLPVISSAFYGDMNGCLFCLKYKYSPPRAFCVTEEEIHHHMSDA